MRALLLHLALRAQRVCRCGGGWRLLLPSCLLLRVSNAGGGVTRVCGRVRASTVNAGAADARTQASCTVALAHTRCSHAPLRIPIPEAHISHLCNVNLHCLALVVTAPPAACDLVTL